MLKRLKVTNFGKHQSKEIRLTDGLNTVVGPNEAGKSTLAVEAIGYAFFGTAMLRETIDDTVTKGEKVSSMKVELDYGDYQITRSKSSAAVIGPDGLKISGQNEVSQFFYDLFGIAKGAERSIAIAEQGDIQGILSARGNAKAVEFIESVAGFSQLDELVEKVKARFPSGSKAALEAMIETDSKELSMELSTAMPNPTPIEQSLEDARKELQANRDEVAKLNSCLNEAQKAASELFYAERDLTDAQEELNKEQAKIATYISQDHEVIQNKEQLVKEASALSSRRESNQRLISDTANARAIASAKQRIDNLKVKEGTEIWEGTMDELIAESMKVSAELKAVQNKRAEAIIQLRNAEATLGKNPICPTCGTDLSSRQEDMKRAAEQMASSMKDNIKEFDGLIAEYGGLAAAIKQISDEHQRILNTVTSIKSLLRTPDQYIAVSNPGELPEMYHWVGGVPSAATPEAVAAAQKELDELQAMEVAMARLDQQQHNLTEALNASLARREELEQRIEKLKAFDFDGTRKIAGGVEHLKTRISEMGAEATKLDGSIDSLSKQLAEMRQIINRHEEKITRLRSNIEAAKKKIEEDQENAELMKEIREARTKVINQVWNLLLETTAEYFSTVRGTDCVIERTDKSFVVNGEKAGRLSGSTRDALGLAIRAATCEIFAPRVNFLLLDEIAAGMDPERTARAMAMVASLPIDQVILCTHEGVSDTLANNVIEV